jgi:hypothetical protein
MHFRLGSAESDVKNPNAVLLPRTACAVPLFRKLFRTCTFFAIPFYLHILQTTTTNMTITSTIRIW